jgi:hypothetical protein
MPNKQLKLQPSNSSNPDLDWSQIRETVLMLNVAVAQIATSLKSGDESVNALANSFTSMVGNVETISVAAENLAPSNEKSTISENCAAVSNQMHATIIAFQFYDQLTQRLTHLSNSLGALAKLLSLPTQVYNPYSWLGLQEKIKSKYTIESDKAMFDAILEGQSVQDALKASLIANKSASKKDEEDDIELF